MRKFQIRVDDFKNFDNIMNFNRMVYTLAVQTDMENFFLYDNLENVIQIPVESKVKMLSDICSRHGSKIRNFYIFNGQFHNPNDLHSILGSMPLLENFNAQRVHLKFVEDAEHFVQPVEMKNLKKLQVSMTGFDFRYFIGSQPKTISLINLERNETSFLNEFVETLEKLESLILSGGVAINMFLQNVENTDFNFKFRLKKLDIDMPAGLLTMNENANEIYIINFLRSQTSSLEELSLRYASSKVLKTALTSLQLNILRLNSTHFDVGNSLPTENRFYDSLQPLTNLKELFVYDAWKDEISVRGILQKCPALVKLEVTRCSGIPKLISYIAASNPNIEHLKLDRLMVESRPEIKFEFLKYLNLTIFDADVGNVTTFLQNNNQTIEKLVIERSNIRPETSVADLVDTLVKMPNLKYLEFNSVACVLKKIYEGFDTSESERPVILVLLFDRMGLGSPRVQFKFPEDAGQWDVKCEFVNTFVRTPHTDFMYRISH